MKVYLMSSPRGIDRLGVSLEKMYNLIAELGHENVTDFLIDVDVDKFYISDIRKFFKQTLSDLKKSDVCVFEVSKPSLAIGHLISTALDLSKPVVALYTKGNLPFFLTGVDDENIQVVEYSPSDLKDVMQDALNLAASRADTRFNFFISPKIGTYLDWISKKKRLPRAVYLRRLIEEDMKQSGYEG